MTIKFIECGEIVKTVKNWTGPTPQIGWKVFLGEDEYEDQYEVIRCTINATKPDILTCHLDML